MAQQQPIAPAAEGDGEDLEDEIVLPEDLQIRACVMYAAGMSLQYKLFSKYPYQIDYKNQQITSLTSMRRDISKSNVEFVAAAKRDGKIIDELPEEHVNLRKWALSPISLVAAIAAVSAFVFYGNYNTGFRDQIVSFWVVNAAFIEGLAVLLLMIFVAWVYVRRRTKRSK